MDEYEVVREVQVRLVDPQHVYRTLTDPQEYFADYAPLLPSLFSLNHTPNAQRPLYGSSPNSWHPAALERSVQGITAVLLSLKKKPIIRYEKMSGMAKKLAGEIQVLVTVSSVREILTASLASHAIRILIIRL